MASPDENADAVRQIMWRWKWSRPDFHGNAEPISIDVSDAINRLAMEGVTRPQDAVLTLLCRGDLTASGDFGWRKYEGGARFQREGTDEVIQLRQWKVLADFIERQKRVFDEGGFGLDPITLEALSMDECHPFEWAFDYNRFDTSVCPIGASIFDPVYFEEWFSAWNITVYPTALAAIPEDIAPLPPSPIANHGGRPAAKWWGDFAEELAVYIHESGIPEGQGHEGQSALIDTVFARMAEKEKPEPSRVTVQPVVNAVLRRIRSAGN